VTELHKEWLLQLIDEEVRTAAAGSFILPVHMDLHVIMCVVGALQLALRHPANTGPSALVVREVIDGIIARVVEAGYVATGEMLRLGDNPDYDETRAPAPTYELLAHGGAIKCLRCGMVSHNLNDVAQLYCANCHRFHEE
jgi:hypothetical protein